MNTIRTLARITVDAFKPRSAVEKEAHLASLRQYAADRAALAAVAS